MKNRFLLDKSESQKSNKDHSFGLGLKLGIHQQIRNYHICSVVKKHTEIHYHSSYSKRTHSLFLSLERTNVTLSVTFNFTLAKINRERQSSSPLTHTFKMISIHINIHSYAHRDTHTHIARRTQTHIRQQHPVTIAQRVLYTHANNGII